MLMHECKFTQVQTFTGIIYNAEPLFILLRYVHNSESQNYELS